MPYDDCDCLHSTEGLKSAYRSKQYLRPIAMAGDKYKNMSNYSFPFWCDSFCTRSTFSHAFRAKGFVFCAYS